MRYTLPTPADIEARAKALNISMAEVFRRCAVGSSTFQRWKAGGGVTLAIVQRLLAATRQPNEDAFETPSEGGPSPA